MKRIATHAWPILWTLTLIAPGSALAVEPGVSPTAQDENIVGACDSIAAAREQLAAVLKLLEEQAFADIGNLRAELEQIQRQALARDQSLAKAEQQLDACSETQTELRQRIATLTAQRDELARSVARLQAAVAETTQETSPGETSPASTTVEPGDAAHDVLMAAQRWAAAWAAQDLDAYLGFYDADFRPPGGMDRQTWEAQRRSRLNKPGRIQVEIADPEVAIDNDQDATLRFIQRYRSDRYSDVTRKRLKFRNRDGLWRIVEEHAGPAG